MAKNVKTSLIDLLYIQKIILGLSFIIKLILYQVVDLSCTCNPSKYEDDILGWLKWQCRLIFESEFWKKFKVTNHRSGVTYGCTDQHLTVEKKNFQSLPSHLADTVEDVKNQPHSRWKIVFLIIQRKWPKFKKWVWPVKIPWKLSILCL